MICEKCQAEGKKSTIYVGASYTTCMGGQSYYDEDGNFHYHDPNTTSTEYQCSNGHSWTKSSRSECSVCKGKKP